MIDTQALHSMRQAHVLEPYIGHIRFPHYKSLSANTRIDFEFPITALVGPNGANKSSVLKALFGAPGQNNLGTRWFSTSVDPISDTGGRPRFIYGFWNGRTRQTVEVIKTRIQKEDNPDYWEPSRPLTRDGMSALPKLSANQSFPDRSQTRWNAIEKQVVYLDFRSELSAFDQYFWFGDLRRSSRIRTKQDFIRKRSVHLKRAIDENLQSIELWGKNRISSNTLFTDAQLTLVSTILGKDYTSVRIVEHSLFDRLASSAVMSSAHLQYSEAFAGSGEFAVLMLVKSISEAPERSLILLDEPEVSLHPGAQDRLVAYLADVVKQNKHQVVMSTHSPTMIRHLPPNAIKVFQLEPAVFQYSVLGRATAAEAFFHLGEPQPNRLRILVEDKLGRELVLAAIRSAPLSLREQIEVEVYPGGAESLLMYYARIFVMENRHDTVIALDGDKFKQEMPDPATIAPAQHGQLAKLIQDTTGVDVPVVVDGGANGGNDQQKIEFQLRFIAWYRSFVQHLPSQTPEEFVWTHAPTTPDMTLITSGSFKERFTELTRSRLGLAPEENINSTDILSVQRQVLATIPHEDQDLKDLRTKIQQYAEGL